MEKYRYILFTMIVIISCGKKGQQEPNYFDLKSQNVEVIKVEGLEKIKKIPEALLQKPVDEIKNEIKPYIKTIPVDKVVKSCKYVKLESSTENAIGSISKISIKNDKIYILDIRNTNSLFVFNMDGSFDYKISSVGKGPGEYYKASDFFIQDDGSVRIFDKNSKKIVLYDTEGRFVSERSFDFWVKSCVPLNNSKYIFYTGFRSNPSVSKNKLYNIIFANMDFEIINKDFEYPISMKNIGYGDSFVFGQYQNEIIYKPALDNNIYQLREDLKFHSKYFIDFGDYALPKKYIQTATFENRVNAIENFRKPRYAKNIKHVFETQSYLAFSFSFRERVFTCYYNKFSKKLVYGNVFSKNNLGLYPDPMPMGVQGNSLVFILEPYLIYNNAMSKDIIKSIKESNEPLSEKMEGWELTSNPIIAIVDTK